MTRREFLSYSAMAGVVGAIGVSPILSACAGGKKKNAYEPLRAEGEYYVPDLPDKAVAGRELKAGVIGCGGRGLLSQRERGHKHHYRCQSGNYLFHSYINLLKCTLL